MTPALETWGVNPVLFRWLLLLPFLMGFLIATRQLAEHVFDFLLYHSIAFFSCAALLTQLRVFSRKVSALWLALFLLLGLYIIRYFWVFIDPDPVRHTLPYNVYSAMIQNSSALFVAYKTSMLAFSSFCLSATGILYFQNRRLGAHSTNVNDIGPQESWFAAKLLMVFVPVIMVVLAYVAHKYRIGQMGVDPGEPLPFRLKGVVFYARLVLLPLLILGLIYLANRSKRHNFEKIGVLLLILHGVIDMLLRGSRSSLLLCILLLVFLAISGGIRVRRVEAAFSLLLTGFAVLAIPVIFKYRMLRFTSDSSIPEVLFEAIRAVGDQSAAQILKTFEFIYFRIPGIECFWSMLSMGVEPLGKASLGVLASQFGITGYLNFNIYKIPVEANTLFAPGFVGWLYLLAGVPAVVIGSIALAIVGASGWKYLGPAYWLCAPVARTFGLWMIFVALTEGTLDGMLFMTTVGVLVVAAMEVALRLIRRWCSPDARIPLAKTVT